jgi:hypothetical protein
MKPPFLPVLLILISLCADPAAQQDRQANVANADATLSHLERSLQPENPFMAGGGLAAQHNDSYSSDVSPLAGPGSGAVNITVTKSGSLCPTLVPDRGGRVFAYCRDPKTRHDSLRLLAPDNLAILASLDMPASGRFGGFYMYVDQDDHIVLGAGDNHLLRVAHSQDTQGDSRLQIVNDWDVSRDIVGHCGSPNCDYLESVTPDWTRKIWFSSEAGVVGTVDPQTGAMRSTTLPKGELVANSISSSLAGVAVPSDHALYLFNSQADGTPIVVWREVYDRGTETKVGRLSQGTGSTPVFFGREGHPYLAITDNGDLQENLLVYRVKAPAAQRLVCKIPLFSPGASADENAPIGIGDSVVLSNTFGYDYDNYTGAALQPLPGGLTRIDVRPDGAGCDIVWTNTARIATVPKLSIRDGNIYTVQRTLNGSTPQYSFMVIDFRTGRTLNQKLVGNYYALDTFELAPLLSVNGILYQPTLTAIIRVVPGDAAHSSDH